MLTVLNKSLMKVVQPTQDIFQICLMGVWKAIYNKSKKPEIEWITFKKFLNFTTLCFSYRISWKSDKSFESLEDI